MSPLSKIKSIKVGIGNKVNIKNEMESRIIVILHTTHSLQGYLLPDLPELNLIPEWALCSRANSK